MVNVLLEARADPNDRDMDRERDPRFSTKGQTEDYSLDHRAPLHYAAERGNVLAADLLLKARADPNAQDGQKCTPLHLCLNLRSADADVEPGAGVRVLGLKSKPEWNGHMASVVGEPADGGEGGTQRWPVLLDDAMEPALLKEDNLMLLSQEILQTLLDSGTDVNLGNQVVGESRGVLHEAAMQGDQPLITAVLAAGAEVNKQESKQGMTALHLAARGKHTGAIRLLLEVRADTALKTSSGSTAVDLAERNRAPAEAIALLRGEGTAAPVPAAPLAAEEADDRPQTLESLTPEQRAMLFMD